MGEWFTAQMLPAFAVCALVGYLLGGIDFAIIVSKKMFSTDVRTLGSGNAGMSNVLRNFGKKGAAFTFIGDALKGVIAVCLGYMFFSMMVTGADYRYGGYVAGVATIVGHMFPLYFGFKGGKGVSTTCGVIFTLDPLIGILLIIVFLVIVKTTGMISLGSVTAVSLYPVCHLVYYLVTGKPLLVFGTVCAVIIALLVDFMHRDNIKRILAGTEYRFGSKGEKDRNAKDDEDDKP